MPDNETAETVGKNNIQAALDIAISGMADKLRREEIKMTVSEFAKLLDLQKERSMDVVQQVKVTWEDPSETEFVPYV